MQPAKASEETKAEAEAEAEAELAWLLPQQPVAPHFTCAVRGTVSFMRSPSSFAPQK